MTRTLFPYGAQQNQNFQKYKYLFIQSVFYLFSIIAKKVNKIRNNVVCIVDRPLFMFCCALTTGNCSAFQHSFIYQKKSQLYDLHFQTLLFFVTMV